MPDESEALGLLALMLLQDSRREARVEPGGELVLLEEQDRSLWDRRRDRDRARACWSEPSRLGPPGPYVLQAAIAAEHARRRDSGRDRLGPDRLSLRAAAQWPALACDRAQPGGRGRDGRGTRARPRRCSMTRSWPTRSTDYQWFWSARADLLRRTGQGDGCKGGLRRALELATNPVERRFIERRLSQLD